MMAQITTQPFALFEALQYGEWHIKRDEDAQLIAIVAIHNTHAGPALGGCRFLEYDSFESALIDASRLAHGMSLKAAISNIPFGGGKSVIMRPKGAFDRKRLFHSFGQFIEDLGGRYITAEDSGTTVADMDTIHEKTQFVTGSSQYSFSHKDPSPLTALGVRKSMEAASQFILDKEGLAGLHIAIQGVGSVGYHLAKECAALGAKLTITDINQQHCQQVAHELGATMVSPDKITGIPCDIFSPCALSNAITKANIGSLQCRIIAGAANNQLESDQLAEHLARKNIIYLPDFMINAGGVIHVAGQYQKDTETQTNEKVANIFQSTENVLTLATQKKQTPLQTALAIIKDKLSNGAKGN